MGNEKDIELNALNEDELDGVSGGTQAGNLLFTGKSVKAVSTVQTGAAPKAGNLVHTKVKSSGKPKTITERDGIDGILLSGGDGPTYC
jgi:hypothetical protein